MQLAIVSSPKVLTPAFDTVTKPLTGSVVLVGEGSKISCPELEGILTKIFRWAPFEAKQVADTFMEGQGEIVARTYSSMIAAKTVATRLKGQYPALKVYAFKDFLND